jgi:hypothetical protein
MREALRDILPTSFACLVLLVGPFARRRHADSHVALCRDGAGLFFFSTGPHSSHKARGRTGRTGGGRWDGRCCTRARRVITEHLAGRRKSPVWSTEATYLLGSTAGVPEGRSAALRDLRWSASLNPHKIWPDCENGHVKEACAGLKALCQRTRCCSACRGLFVLGAAAQAYEPRARAAPAPPRPAAAGTGEGQRTQPRCRSGSPATEPSGPGAKLDPPDHTQPNPAPHVLTGPRGRTANGNGGQ